MNVAAAAAAVVVAAGTAAVVATVAALAPEFIKREPWCLGHEGTHWRSGGALFGLLQAPPLR